MRLKQYFQALNRIFLILIFFNIFIINNVSYSKNIEYNSETISLEKYLELVKNQNGLYQNYKEKIVSSKLKIEEKNLITSPSFFTTANYSTNYKKSTEKDLSYDHKDYLEYSIGVEKNTDIGLSGKIYYNINKTTYIEPDPTDTDNKSTGTLAIELKQDLLKNSFGQVTRANKNVIEHQNMAEYYNSKYNLNILLKNAENTYWNLVITNAIEEVKLETLKQNIEMENYTLKKVKMNLMDKSNELQSRAALELAKLNLQEVKDNQKDLIRLFNSLIGVDSDVLNVNLVNVPWKYLENYKITKEYNATSQLKSLEKQVKVIDSNYIIDKNKYKPTLNLVAGYTLNSEHNGISDNVKSINNTDEPTKYIGMNFSIPLSFSSIKSFNESSYKEQNAIKLQYKQQMLSDKVTWNQLLDRLSYAQARLKLARNVEAIQNEKLKNEIKRWKNGISSTYQVLQFQSELTESRQNSLNIANEIFNIIANLKLFETEEKI